MRITICGLNSAGNSLDKKRTVWGLNIVQVAMENGKMENNGSSTNSEKAPDTSTDTTVSVTSNNDLLVSSKLYQDISTNLKIIISKLLKQLIPKIKTLKLNKPMISGV